MADPILDAFLRYDAARERWQDEYKRPADRSRARQSAVDVFDRQLDSVFGPPSKKIGGNLSPTERAFARTTSRDEAQKVYDAAVSAAVTRYKGKTTSKKYQAAVKKYGKYRDRAVSRIDSVLASKTSNSGNPIGLPAGSPNSGSAPIRQTLTPTGSVVVDDSSDLFLWIGGGLLAWYFLKG